MVKVIDRVMHKLGEMVRPFAHKILVVVEPMLIDEDTLLAWKAGRSFPI